jgi:RHS repeat-associated protein
MFRPVLLASILLATLTTLHAADPDGHNSGPDASKADKTAGPSGKLNFQTDLFTGRFGYSVPIQVAPGRNGSEPQIGLRYNSASEDGWCGHGWDLDLGYIQRETKRGVPVKWGSVFPLKEYDDAKGFVFSLGGQSASLVGVAANEYRAEIEAGFLKFSLITNVGGTTTNYWQVIDKGGNKYFFGLTSNSRMVNAKTGWSSNTASGTFRWALSRIETVTGDTTAMTYTNITGVQYPLVLAYNGHTSGLTNSHTVEFQLGDRTDKRFAYNSGYRVETTKRLTNVLAKVSGRLVRRYLIGYTNSPSTTRSLIRSVTMFGTNSTDSLPPLTFNYSAQPFQFEAAVNWGNLYLPYTVAGWNQLSFSDSFGLLADLVDVDGDGLPDRLLQDYNPPGASSPWTTFKMQRNTGSGFANIINWGPLTSQSQTGNTRWSVINSTYTRFLDINGDGLPDRVMDNYPSYINQPNARYTNFWIEFNTGTNFTGDTVWTNVVPINNGAFDPVPNFLAIENGSFVKMADMNGDGLPDRVMRGWQVQFTTPYTNLWVQFNTGSGFAGTNAFGPYYSQGQSNDTVWAAVESAYVRLMDINGDGLPDRVMGPRNTITGDGFWQDQRFTNFVVEFNNGYGFEPAVIWGGVDPQYDQPATANCAGAQTSQYCTISDTDSVALRDVNADGLPDRVMRTYCYPHTNFLVQLNTGNGFAPVRNFGPYFSQGQSGVQSSIFCSVESSVARLMDINGDGLIDRVMSKYNALVSDDYFVAELNKGPFPDLLTSVSNGIGGTVTASYTPSTQYDNRESTNSANAKRLLPFPLYTVSSVSVSDGFYPSNMTTYSYEGGMWSSERREFHGFARVQVTDPLGLSTVQWFHQAGGRDNSALGEYQDTAGGIAKKGMSFRTETIGTNGQLYKLALNKVVDADLGSGRHFAFVPQTIEIDYVGTNSGSRASAQGFQYDVATGNLLVATNYGEVTVTSIPNHITTDAGSDVFYQLTTYATLVNTNIVDKPQSVTLTDDAAGSTILRESLFDYDGNTGNLTRQRDRICAGSYRANSFGYDTYGNRTAATNAAGIVTQILFDTAYQTFPRQQTTAGSYVSSSILDVLSGSLISSTDIKGLVTSNALDSLLRLTNTSISTTPNGAASLWVVRYSYGLGGIVSGASKNSLRIRKNDDVDASNGHETWIYYDGLGRSVQTRIEAETNGYRVTDTVYDARGTARWEGQPYFSGGTSTATNHVPPTGTKPGTSRDYDPIARLVKVTPFVDASFSAAGLLQNISVPAGDGSSPVGPTQTAYNDGTDPWAIVHIDEESKATKFLLDAYGHTNQIVEVTSGGNYTTTLRYDKAGSLTNIADHAGNASEYAYNDLGELIIMADPDMGVWEYRRDFAGRIREQVDAKTNLVRFDYTDPLGRLKSRNAYNPQGAFVFGVTNFYDSSDDGAFTAFSGQLYKATDSEGWQKNGYDVRGRTLKTARFLTKNGQTYTNQFVYDDADRVRTNIYPANGPTIRQSYDTAGNLSEIRRIDGTNNLAYYQIRGFNALGQQVGINFGNGVISTNDYWTTSKRLRRVVTFKSGSTNIQDLTYSYDKAANVKSITDGVYSGSAAATLTSIQYDDLHRLTSLTHPTQGTKTYSYSAIGNIAANGEIGADTYNYGVRMPHAVKTVGSIRSYGYDANGNMISRNGQRLDYDLENRLARVISLTSTNIFGYDGGGTRLWKQGTNTLQVWIGGLYEEKQGRVLFHVQTEDLTVCTFDATTTNVFEYYHNDHLHSTSVLTDKSGNRVQHHEYSAFGRDRFTESAVAFPLSRRYNSKSLDEDTGLYFYGARYYDPELGRFLQPDTIIPELGNPQSYNRYSYVLNNPLKHVDPDGHQPVLTPSQAGFISQPVRSQIEFHRFLRETGQEYRPQGRYSGQYPAAFERAVERSIAERGERMLYGRVLRPGEAFLSAAPEPGGARLTGQAINQATESLLLPSRPPEVLFGQRRIDPNFSTKEGVPSYLSGRPISDVAADLRSGVLSPNQLPVQAYKNEAGQTISLNSRTLGALSEAGMRPTIINMTTPSRSQLLRLNQKPIINSPIPGPKIPVTPSQSDPTVMRVIKIPDV